MNEFLKNLENSLIDFECASDLLKSELVGLITRGGKRVRPRLARLVVLANGETLSKQQLILITAGELLHTASLIHDDIIDVADTRRGDTPLYKKFDEKLAVIAGDLLASVAMNKVVSLKNIEIIRMFQSIFQEMCNAEIVQYFERGQLPTLEFYLDKSRKKTGLLFGGILSGVSTLAENIDSAKMFEFGVHFGTAFQIRNDLESFGTEDSNDRFNQVFTAPDIFLKESCDIKSAIEKTELLIDNEKKSAISIMEQLPDNEYKQELKRMVEGL